MRKGFTLIETLLAMFLLALGLASVAYMIPIATHGLGQSKFVTQATFFAQQRMEEALTSPTTPAVTVDADEPLLTGEIRRVTYNQDANLTYAQVRVYRSDDASRRTIVELESVASGGLPAL